MKNVLSQREIGKRIKAVRKKAGLKVGEVAKKLEVTRQTVYYWETGQKAITLTNLRKFSQVTQVPVGVIFERGKIA